MKDTLDAGGKNWTDVSVECACKSFERYCNQILYFNLFDALGKSIVHTAASKKMYISTCVY